MSIGVGIFLMVLGAILAFAVEATTPRDQRQCPQDYFAAHRLGCGAVLAAVLEQRFPLGRAQDRRPPP
jgi:hypothetical protein